MPTLRHGYHLQHNTPHLKSKYFCRCRKFLPLEINNTLPSIEIRFASTRKNRISFFCHDYSCAGMNAVNVSSINGSFLHIHKLIVSYEYFNDAKSFDPVNLDFAVPNKSTYQLSEKLTDIVEYWTNFSFLKW